jgi:hypothetical protein
MIPRKSCQETLEEWHDWIYYQKINKKKSKKGRKVLWFFQQVEKVKIIFHVKNRAGD